MALRNRSTLRSARHPTGVPPASRCNQLHGSANLPAHRRHVVCLFGSMSPWPTYNSNAPHAARTKPQPPARSRHHHNWPLRASPGGKPRSCLNPYPCLWGALAPLQPRHACLPHLLASAHRLAQPMRSKRCADLLNILLHHLPHELAKRVPRLPAQSAASLRGISKQQFYVRRTLEPFIRYNIIPIIEPHL